jgi:hypothetical protein
MNKKTPSVLDKEISLEDIFKIIFKNKFLIIIATLLFGFGHYYYIDKYKVESVKFKMDQEIQTHSLLQKPSEHMFVNFVNTYQSFFSELYESEKKTIIRYERNNFHNIFKLKFLSLDNFISFLKKNDYLDLYETINNELINKKIKFQKRIGFAKSENLEFENDKNTETVFLRHDLSVDGHKILTEYILDTYTDALNIYLSEKKDEFEVIVSIYKNSLKTAEKLNVIDPFLVSRKKINLENDTTEYYTTLDPNALYLRGTIILTNIINEMEKKLSEFHQLKIKFNSIKFNPIIDTAYTFSTDKTNNANAVPSYLKSLLLGFFLSLIIIFIKNKYAKNNN